MYGEDDEEHVGVVPRDVSVVPRDVSGLHDAP